jgi:hypothetical protein
VVRGTRKRSHTCNLLTSGANYKKTKHRKIKKSLILINHKENMTDGCTMANIQLYARISTFSIHTSIVSCHDTITIQQKVETS